MKLADFLNEDRGDDLMMHRQRDDRPTVGDRRQWGGASGVLIKQAKRLEHVVDELLGHKEISIHNADDIVKQKFRDALDELNAFADDNL